MPGAMSRMKMLKNSHRASEDSSEAATLRKVMEKSMASPIQKAP